MDLVKRLTVVRQRLYSIGYQDGAQDKEAGRSSLVIEMEHELGSKGTMGGKSIGVDIGDLYVLGYKEGYEEEVRR